MPAQDDQGRRLALIVASSDYRDPTLRQLRAPGHDASDLAEVLRDPAIGAFDVRTLINTPSDQLLRVIAQFCRQPGPGDLVLVYLSCHGVLDDRGRLYYAATDTERDLLSATAVAAQWLSDQLDDCRARRQILMLDCCHSGAFAKGSKGDDVLALRDRFSGRGKVVLTASGATEYSFEGAAVIGEGVRSVFTRTVVDGLRTGQADLDKDGLVTVNDLYHYVYDTVRAVERRQTPELWAFGAEGDLLVAQSPRGPIVEPVPLPEDVRQLVESPRPAGRESGVKVLAELVDHGEPGLALTARLTLQRISEEDLPRIAALARAACNAGHGQAVTQLEAHEQARREAEEEARRQEAERAAAQRQQQIDQLQRQLRDHAATQDWDAVLAVSGQLAALDPAAADPDALASTAREQITRRQEAERAAAQRQQQIDQLQRQLRDHAATQDWDAVLAVSEQLAALDPAAADPDALASTAREQITRRQEAERAAAQRQQQIDQLQRQLRDHAATQDWDAVLAVSEQLAALDPAAADPDALASTAREQITRRQEAERAAAQRRDDVETVSQHGEDLTSTPVQEPRPSPGEETPQTPGHPPVGRSISRRTILVATGAAIAVIGLITAIIIVVGQGPTGPTPHVRWTYATGGYVESSPAVADGTVYVGSDDNNVYALNAATGHVLWTYTTGSEINSSPAVANGTVYTGSEDDKVYALNAATGHVLWTYTTGGNVDSTPAVAGGTVYIGSDDHKVYALNAATGHLVWIYTTGGNVASSPAVADGTVYVGSFDSNVYALNAATGHVLWTYTTGGGIDDSSPAVADGTVYIGSSDNNLYALNAATGHVLWTYTTGGVIESRPAVADGTVYIGSEDDKVYALNAATGHVLWTYTTGGNVNSSPAVADGTVYIGSDDHKVYALNAATGHVVWTYTTGGSVDSSPAVAGGTVYIGSDDNKVYALSAGL